jgi:single-strand DNA-binding protein
MLNTISVTGRFAREPELRFTQQDTAVASLRLAVERDYAGEGGKRGTDFFDVAAWRGTAEFICNHFDKGDLITIVGRLQTRAWTDKEGGKRTSVEIVADKAYFCGGKPKDNGGTEPQNPLDDEPDDYGDDDLPM